MTALRKQESQTRSLAKAVSWRVTGTIDTFIISAIVTGRLTLAGSTGRRLRNDDLPVPPAAMPSAVISKGQVSRRVKRTLVACHCLNIL
jgi:hypothetical protein